MTVATPSLAAARRASLASPRTPHRSRSRNNPRCAIGCAALLGALAWSALASADTGLALNPTPQPESTLTARDAALLDMDGDGDLDWVSVAPNRDAWVGENVGGGVFRAAPFALAGSGGAVVERIRLNDDARDDLVIVFNQTATFWRAQAGGGFAREAASVQAAGLKGVAAGDLNGDGLHDLFAAARDDLVVALSNGTAPQATGQQLGSALGLDVALGDLDGDGDLDAITSHTVPDDPVTLRVWLNNGAGSFQAGPALPTTTPGARYIALGDLNGDGRLDLIASPATAGPALIFLGNADGPTFTRHTPSEGLLPSLSPNADLRLGDLDGDGNLDLLAVAADGRPAAWCGDGSGGFARLEAAPSAADPIVPSALRLGDLDGDGDLDAALIADQASPDGTTASTWFNAPTDAPLAAPVWVGPTSADEGAQVTWLARLDQPAGAAQTWTFDWADGARDTVTVPAGRVNTVVRLTHAWNDEGIYNLELAAGGDALNTRSISIANVAPDIFDIQAPTSVNEGQTWLAAAIVDDPGPDDALRFAWDFGDGANLNGVGLDSVDHVFLRNGPSTVTVTVDDQDGGSDSASIQVNVQNQPPAFASRPVRFIQPGDLYVYDVDVSDPGGGNVALQADPIPRGASFTARQLTWPTGPNDRSTTPYPVTLTACDTDGACAEQSWELLVGFDDADADGTPDACERASGLDPSDPSDATEDADGDGVSNRDECLLGTDPSRSNGPTAPTPTSPADGAVLATLTPDLTVSNASDPDGDPLTYTFEVFSDAALTRRVASASDLPEGASTTRWRVASALPDNARYWWRARASDPGLDGPWSPTRAFVVSTANTPPSAPQPLRPSGLIDTTVPPFELQAASDLQGDALTYTLELVDPADPNTVLRTATFTGTQWLPDSPLQEDSDYAWRARATDDQGAQGPWSGYVTFQINTDNTPPPAPVVLEPAQGATLETSSVQLRWETVTDPDGDNVTYDVELAREASFAAIERAFGDLVADDGATTMRQELLVDNSAQTTWHARVRAVDPQRPGPWATVRFVVAPRGATNTAPSAPTVNYPTRDAQVPAESAVLIVNNASDPDGDPLTYTFEVFADADGAERIAQLPDLPEGADGTTIADLTALNLPAGRTLYWSAFAEDPLPAASPSTPRTPFELVAAGGGSGGDDDDGCGCATPAQPAPAAPTGGLLLGALLALVGLRRRARRA